MKNENLSKKMNKLLAAICKSDVILVNGQKYAVGLYYEQGLFDDPIVLLKTSNLYSDYFFKIVRAMSIPYLEDKLLAAALFKETGERECISNKFIAPVANLYSKYVKKIEQVDPSNFDERLSNDVMSIFNLNVRRACKSAERKVLKTLPVAERKQFSDKDTLGYIEELLTVFANKNGLNLRISDKAFVERNFCIDSMIVMDIQNCKLNFSFWQMLNVSLLERKIYVGNIGRFRVFDIEDVVYALDYYVELFSCCEKKIFDDIAKLYNEFGITFKSYSLAQNMVKTMLDMNRKNNAIEYLLYSDTAVISIILQKKYMVTITYNAFLHSPAAFKDFIANPRPKKTWNFCCRETICR